MIVALLALFVALGGPAQAARVLDGRHIKRGTVASKQVKDRSLKTRDLSPAAVRDLTATQDASITHAQLAPGAVHTEALAPGSVLTGSVGDDSLTAADLAPNSAGADEVADNAVGQAEIRNNGVGASEIADTSIDGGEVIDGGLSVRDVARHVSSFEWSVPLLAPGLCDVTARVPVTGLDVSGALVLASPRAGWPAGLVYTVNGTGASGSFHVQACNRGLAPVPADTYRFNYAVLGP